jgi:osmoprotectant transport system permease protein
LVILTDPKAAIPPYDAVVLVSPRRAGDKRLLGALTPLIGKIDVAAMQAANYSVDRDAQKASPAEAARALDRQILPSP